MILVYIYVLINEIILQIPKRKNKKISTQGKNSNVQIEKKYEDILKKVASFIVFIYLLFSIKKKRKIPSLFLCGFKKETHMWKLSSHMLVVYYPLNQLFTYRLYTLYYLYKILFLHCQESSVFN